MPRPGTEAVAQGGGAPRAFPSPGPHVKLGRARNPSMAGSCHADVEDPPMLTSNAASAPAAAAGADAFTIEDIEYLHHDGKTAPLAPVQTERCWALPLLVDLHGGAWCGQDRRPMPFQRGAGKQRRGRCRPRLSHAADCRLSGFAGRHQLCHPLAEGTRRRAQIAGGPRRSARRLEAVPTRPCSQPCGRATRAMPPSLCCARRTRCQRRCRRADLAGHRSTARVSTTPSACRRGRQIP